MFPIYLLLTEQEIEAAFAKALENRFLPENLFYWTHASVQAWLALCSEGPYHVYARSYALLQAKAGEIANGLPDGDLEIVSLGTGSGEKDHLLMKALAAKRRRLSYVPVDASQRLLEIACRMTADSGCLNKGFKADVFRSFSPDRDRNIADPEHDPDFPCSR